MLISVSLGKASINEKKSRVSLTILPNDNPHGVIQFTQQKLSVNEEENSVNVTLQIKRSDGLYGMLRVYYRYNIIS